MNEEKGISLPRGLAFLSLVWAALMVGIVAYLLAVSIHDGGLGRMPLEVKSAVGAGQLTENIQVTDRSDIIYVTLPFSLGFTVYLLMIAELLKYAAFAAVFIFLAKFFHTVAKGSVFAEKNSRYLNFAGNTVAGVGIYHYFRGPLITRTVESEFTESGMNYGSSSGYAIEFIMMGLVILVFAYVLKEGRKIYQEQELTI